jgi:hypothetical protein
MDVLLVQHGNYNPDELNTFVSLFLLIGLIVTQ